MELLTEERYEFAGSGILIRSNSDKLLAHLRAVYGRFLRETAEPSHGYTETSGNKPVVTIDILDERSALNEITVNDGFYMYRISRHNGTYKWSYQEMKPGAPKYTDECDLLHFVQTVVLRTVTLTLTAYNLFHAGVVAWRNRGIVLAAHPDMGKTTLTLKLVMSGCGFLSDEIACFTPDLSGLVAFPRSVSIRNNSRKLLGLPEFTQSTDVIKTAENEWMLDIEKIVPGSLAEACTPDFIFFLRGFGDRPRLEPMPASAALLELLKFTYCPVPDPAKLLYECAPLINSLRCYSLISGNLDETAQLILNEADREIS